MEIFKATCPSCERQFDCDIALASPSVARLRCPWCGAYFDRAASPRIFGRGGKQGTTWERSEGSHEIALVEFAPPPVQRQSSPRGTGAG